MRWVILVLVSAGAVGCVANETTVVAIDARSGTCATDDSAKMFDGALADYGAWSEDDTYGRVWTPNDAAFVPYSTDGHFDDLGTDLVWTSDLPWGGITLHHGRWVHCRDRWRWVPGTEYSAAWVEWTRQGAYVSWSPKAPTRVFRRGAFVPIEVIAQPVVGTRSDDELARVPPALPPAEIVNATPADAARADNEAKYKEIGRRIASDGEDIAENGFNGFDGWSSGRHGAASGGHGGHVASSFGSTHASMGGHGGRHGVGGHR